MSFPRYQRYKDSGVDWLGEVPAHWEVIPLKRLADFINGDAFKPTEWADSGTPIIRIQNLNGGEEFNYYDGEVESRYLVHDGDLLFGWSGNRGTSFGPFLWRRKEVCALNQHIFRVVPLSVSTQSLYWTLKAVTAHVEDQAHGIIGMVHITKGDLGAINVPIPPEQEHRQLAIFLDQETAKIDALIEEQRRLIDLLKEKRQAVISHAVTKGLNPDAPMKDCGVDWIGLIPQHWEVSKLGQTANIVRGGSPRPAGDSRFFNGDFMPWITVGEVTKDDSMYLVATESMLTEVGAEQSRTIDSGTLVLTNSGATLGVPKILGITGCANDGILAFLDLNANANKKYLYFVLGSLTSELRERMKQGSGQPNLNTGIVSALQVPLPPVVEQLAIVAELERMQDEFGALMAQAETSVTLLQERRSALVSAAVTGKIDVRNYTSKEAA